MFKQFSNRQLALALGVLALLYGLTWLTGRRPERSFAETLLEIDPAAVDRLLISSAQGQADMRKSGDSWQISLPDGSYAAAAAPQVSQALDRLKSLKALQLVSQKEEQWASYGVADSNGLRVEAYTGGRQQAVLVLGRQQYAAAGAGGTFVRIGNEPAVYLAEGMLLSSFSRNPQDWRDKTVLRGNSESWQSLSLAFPGDSAYQLVRSGVRWTFADGAAADSAAVQRYLSRLAEVRAAELASDPPGAPQPAYALTIGEADGNLIRIQAYPDSLHGHILTSSQQPGNLFSARGGLLDRLFPGRSTLRPQDRETQP